MVTGVSVRQVWSRPSRPDDGTKTAGTAVSILDSPIPILASMPTLTLFFKPAKP